MDFAGRDGTRLFYQEVGGGRPVILLHGFTGSGAEWAGTGIAGRLAERGRRVIMPDLRGHGDSTRPHDAASWTPDVLADDGLALIEHLGLTDYDLAGYSFGGRVTVRLLARGAAPRRAVAAGQGLEAVLHAEGRGEMYRRAFGAFGTNAFAEGTPERGIEDWITGTAGDPVALEGALDSFVNTSREELAGIKVPVLVAVGAEDGHAATGPALADAVADGRYVELPGGHVEAYVSPEFEAVLTDFLTP